ncbi:MAG: hypothetical protein M1820_008680, partial [Bogoriella megaspora]
EPTGDNNKDTPHNHEHPAFRLVYLSLTPVVIKPHASHGLKRHQRSKKSADKSNKAAKNGDSTSDDVRDEGVASSAA